MVRGVGVEHVYVSDEAGLERLADEWDDLVRQAPRPSPFLLHSWLVEWWRHFGSGSRLAVHVARRDGRLVAALPLFATRARGVEVGRLIGHGQSAIGDALLAPGESIAVVADLLTHASRSFDYAHLHAIPGHSNFAAAAPGRLEPIPRLGAPVLDLTDGWEAVYAAKTSSQRRKLHRKRRRQLNELGSCATRVLTTRSEIEAVFDETVRVHRARWQGSYDGSGYASEPGQSFHRAAFLRLADQGYIRFVTLTVDGRIAAFQQYFALSGRMYCYRTAFDPQFSHSSPGVLTILDALEAASAEGLTRAEFLGGDEEYKLELADGPDPLYDAFGLATSVKGQAAATARRRTLELRLRLKSSARIQRGYHGVRSLLSR